jgi:Ca2+-binding EF-hand superfamily protein
MADLRGRLGQISKVVAPRLTANFRPTIGAAPITASIQERLERLRKDFAEIDSNGDKMLTFDEIYSFLSKKAGRDFDRRLCQKLFDKMDKDKDSIVSADEFILSYIDAEKLYQSKIADLQKQVQDSFEQMEDAQDKMKATANIEELNSYGIMKGSVLTVHVVKAQNLIPMDIGGASDPYVILSCEGQQIETRYISNDLNPVWEETFTFQIQRGTEDLSVIVMDYDTFGKHDFEGQVIIPLQSIADQMKHDQFFELHGKDPSDPWQGRIHLNLQWIWSKARYWEILASQWKDNLEVVQSELKAYQDHLAKLQEPFATLDLSGEDFTANPRTGGGMTQYGASVTTGITGYFETAVVNRLEWGSSAQLIFTAYVTLTLCAMFMRPDFVDLTLGVLIALLVFSKTLTPRTAKYLATAVAVSELFDLTWFTIYLSVRLTQHWTSSEEAGVEGDVVSFVGLVSVANFVLKVPVAAALWKLALEMQQAPRQTI